jgi:hypothetical protein
MLVGADGSVYQHFSSAGSGVRPWVTIGGDRADFNSEVCGDRHELAPKKPQRLVPRRHLEEIVTMAQQDQWRFCNQCNAMFFDGFPTKGACPAGGGHQSQGFMFVLPHDVPPTNLAQDQWRFCNQCNAMFFDGFPTKGACPAGGGHQSQGFMFVLPHIAAG